MRNEFWQGGEGGIVREEKPSRREEGFTELNFYLK
jgi:hypothetical protein